MRTGVLMLFGLLKPVGDRSLSMPEEELLVVDRDERVESRLGRNASAGCGPLVKGDT